MGWLDPLFGPSKFRKNDGTPLPQRGHVKILDGGSGIVSDDATNDQTIIDLSSIGAGVGSGTNVHYTGVLALKDVVVSALDTVDPQKVTKATSAALTAAPTIRGIVLAVNADGTVTIPLPGAMLLPSATGLTAPTKSGWVVVDPSTSRALHKDVAAFGDNVIGRDDTAGNLHFLPPHERSRVAQAFIDPRDYGNIPGDPTTDGTAQVLAALAQAQTNTVNASYPNFQTVRFPVGATQISKPLRVNQSGITIEGHGELISTVRPNFQGPWCVVGPDLTDLPPVLANGPFGGCALNCDQGRQYTIPLRMCGVGELAGLTQFTVEAWCYLTAAITAGQDPAVIVASTGKEKSLPNLFDSAIQFTIGHEFTTDSETSCVLNIGGTLFQVRSSSTLSTGTWHHLAVSWDGTTVRLFIDGAAIGGTGVADTSSKLNGTIVQQPWENCFLARATSLVGEYALFAPNGKLRIGPTRGSNAALYTTTFTPPAAPFTPGNITDIWVINWDEGLAGTGNDNVVASDVYKGYSGGTGTPSSARNVWLPTWGGRGTLDHELSYVSIQNLRVYGDNGATAGGVFIQQTLHWKLWHYQTQLTWFHSWTRDNSFESHASFGTHNGSNFFPGVINFTTSGDVINGYNVQQCSYSYLLSGGTELTNCTVGTWLDGCAGVHLSAGAFNLENCFWDAESQPRPSRGAIMADASKVTARGLQGTGGAIDTPFVTLDGTDADLEFRTASPSFQSAIVDVLSAPPNQIKVRGLDYGVLTPAVTSSTNAPLGKVFVEGKTAGDLVGSSISNGGQLDQHHGDTLTTGATQTALSDCAIKLDPHSSVTICAEITGRKDNDTDVGTWDIKEVWKRGRLGTAPALVVAAPNSPTSYGSNAGATPASWAAALVSDGVDTVTPKVTGVASTNIEWSGNIVVTRSKTAAPTWGPLELAPAAWFRGDVGTTASWTDQSGNGFNAAAGTTAPTTTTLGGQAAFAFGGGGWFQSTANSLLTAGGPFTVLAVAQASDAVGGFLWTGRLDTSPLGICIYTSGPTYVASCVGNTTLLSSPAQLNQPRPAKYDAESPFYAEWSGYPVAGGARLIRFDLLGPSIRYTSGTIGVESGATGFSIGKNVAAGLGWNGAIAELVIVNRSITLSERAFWVAYAKARYGL